MSHLGVDISAQTSKHLDQFHGDTFDYVITVCDQAEECPTFPGEPNVIHWSIPDPVVAGGTAQARLAVFIATAQALATRVRVFAAAARCRGSARLSLQLGNYLEGDAVQRPSLIRRAGAEAIGAYGIVTAGCGAIMVNTLTGSLGHVGVALTFGLTVAVMIARQAVLPAHTLTLR